MDLSQIQLSNSLEDVARIGVVFLKQLENGAASASLRKRIETLAQELRQSIGDRPLLGIEGVRKTRRLFELLGLDPSDDVPSSEKLLLRVLQNQTLPKLNKLADAVNLASLSCQCPISVYDWDKIVPPVLVRIGRPDESYVGHSGKMMAFDGKLALVDGEGLFGNPSCDSARTHITLGTVRAMVVAWSAAETPKSHVEAALKETVALAKEFCEARVGELGILG
jgi:DNA/RNA-binding domain of Phe-tRNA-synthetase-like protein